MVRINFDMPDIEYLKLKTIVGNKNVANTFRKYAYHIINGGDVDRAKIMSEYEITKKIYEDLKQKVDIIRAEGELSNLEKKQKEADKKRELLKMKGRTMKKYLSNVV